MVNDFTKSQTYQNLLNAYHRDLITCAKYQIYADNARRNGYQQIANIFDETAVNEQAHSEIWLRFIIQSNQLPSTLETLRDSSQIEYYEGTDLYLKYAETAREEGYIDIANMFEGISAIERHHYFRFNELASNIENDQVFCKTSSTVWVCLKCGNLVWSECAPQECPICHYPQGFYQLNCENY